MTHICPAPGTLPNPDARANCRDNNDLLASPYLAGTLQYAAATTHRSLTVHRPVLSSAVVLSAFAAPLAAQQSDLTLSPFVTLLPTAGSNPLAGLALTLAGDGGFSLRASAHLSLQNTNSSSFSLGSTMRPWGADADAVLSIGGRAFGYRRTFAPFVFAGIGTAGKDSGGVR